MELIKFEYSKGATYCPNCGGDTDCPECYAKMDCCSRCGESIEKHDCFIVLTCEKNHGLNKPSTYTATLIIDGEDFARAYIEEQNDKSGDIAHLELSYIAKENQTETFAGIISNFAKWVRFDWRNPNKITDLPTLVSLIGFTVDKRYGTFWHIEKWIALQDAIKIRPEHLACEFTLKEMI